MSSQNPTAPTTRATTTTAVLTVFDIRYLPRETKGDTGVLRDKRLRTSTASNALRHLRRDLIGPSERPYMARPTETSRFSRLLAHGDASKPRNCAPVRLRFCHGAR